MVKEKSHKAVLMSNKTKTIGEMGVDFKNSLYKISYSIDGDNVLTTESKIYK